ncbi:MAG: N-6 DNA methylase [Pyrinomonadaceae bacterium]
MTEHSDTAPDDQLDGSYVGQWMWAVVSNVSGARDPELFYRYVLPLILYKRLSDVSEDLRDGDPWSQGGEDAIRTLFASDVAYTIRHEGITKLFNVPHEFRWESLRACPLYELNDLLPRIMSAVAEQTPDLRWLLDSADYARHPGSGRVFEPRSLAELIHGLSAHRLGLKDITACAMGDAFEYLLQRYVESQSRVTGNFYTPRDVVAMMTHLLDTNEGSAMYDPACGSGGLLVNARKFIERNEHGRESDGPALYGRELETDIFTVAKINMLLHGYYDSDVRVGSIWLQPTFRDDDPQWPERFDRVITNPPWNQKPYDYGAGFYQFADRRLFPYGPPPKSSADWGWLQHIRASLSEKGRAAVVLDTGAVTRGSGSKLWNREKEIRQAFVDEDVIEAVLLLPKNLFYGTTSAAVILFLNAGKPADRKGQILLADISSHFARKGRKNVLTHEGMAAFSESYHRWEANEELSRIITLEEARDSGYNLLPSNFIEPELQVKPFDKRVFISYSSADEILARRLLADLKRRRIQCWFAPEDLKIGARIRPAIDEAIQKHDKLLLILSKHSVESAWVEQEVETAMRREREQKETILFPISLDGGVFEKKEGWPAYISNTRNIGDFRGWESAGKYQKAFKRLLRDLTSTD